MQRPGETSTPELGSGTGQSSYSQAQNDCIELTTEVTGWVGVRDSKLGAYSPVLASPCPQLQISARPRNGK
ncbi:MAG: DUF397 domain-containing protein [Pseudonocardiaceae bacterium]